MTRLGHLEGLFPWGLDLVTDEGSPDQIPDFDTEGNQATASQSAVALRIRHEVDGPAELNIWSDEPSLVGHVIFNGTVRVMSGTLQIGDALGVNAIRLAVKSPYVRVRALASQLSYADRIDIVIGDGAST